MRKSVKILIAEDEAIIAADLEKSLKKLNYQVVGIENSGENVIEAAKDKTPDLILMDIMLNGKINGIEAAQKIKEDFDIPVIYLTAYADEKTLQDAKITEPFGYILKPFDEIDLNSHIQLAVYKHQANKKLMESEKRYRTLVETSPIAIGIHCEGKVVYTNSAGVKLFGANSAEDLLGKPIMDLVIPCFRDIVEQRVKHVTTSKEILEPLEEKLRTLDGRELDVEVTAIPTKFDGKDAVQVIITDISEIKKRVRIQQTIVRILQSVNHSLTLDQQFDYLQKTLIDFIDIKNICFALYDKTKNLLTFPSFSDEFDEKPKERNFSNGIIEFVIKSARIQLLNYDEINKLIAEKTISFKEKVPKVWLGIPVELEENLTLVIVCKEYFNENFLGEKEVELISAIILPLTRVLERKLLEMEKNQALKELEELNQTKDKFFSILSHDLRSPFDSILGFTEILKNEFEELSKEEIKIYLESLYQSSRHIYNLLTNLLHYSKFQLGKTEFNPKKINLYSALLDTIGILSGNALKKDISLLNLISQDVFVSADSDMLNSIFMNLISNAIKFTKRGGEVKVFCEAYENFVKISVQDNGIGIEKGEIERLFKLDYKKSTYGTENESGTGIGLLIVKQYVEKHGGTITANSKVGEGTTMTFTIPKA